MRWGWRSARAATAGWSAHGAAQAVVTASFDPPAADGADRRRCSPRTGSTIEPGEPLIVRRIVKADGGSRGFVNDQPASAGVAARARRARWSKSTASMTIAACSTPRGHRALLDAFARIDRRRRSRARMARWRDAEDALAARARRAWTTPTRDREWLEHAVAELTRASRPSRARKRNSPTRRAAMQRGEKIAGDLQAIADLLDGSDGGLARLRQAARVLERVADDHAALAEALAAIDRAIIEGAQAQDTHRCRRRGAGVRSGAARGRRDAAVRPARAGAQAPRPARRSRGAGRRAGARGSTDRERRRRASPRWSARCETRARAYDAAAAALSEARRRAAARLDAAVAGELAPLKLDAARFRTVVEPLAPKRNGRPPGKDRVEFEISTNPGAPFAPLAKIASGGELSRFILALKVALAEQGGADDDDLRRDRPRRRRRGGERDRRAAGAAGRAARRCWW